MSSIKSVPLTCHGHSRPITHLNFSTILKDDHILIISGCKDNNPMLRDGVTGDWIGTFVGHKGAVWQSRLSSDALYAGTASADFTAKIWDTYTGECLNTLQHEHIVRAVAFPQVANPNLIATGGFEKKLRIWDMNRTESQPSSNSSSPTISLENSGGPSLSHSEMGSGAFGGVIKSIVWGADYNLVITASDDKAVRWWDLRSRTPITKADLEGELGTCEMNTTPSSYKSVLSVASGKNAYFFEGQTPGQLLKKVTTQHDIASLAFNLDERKFVVGGKNDTYVRVYDFDQEKELDVYKGHHGPIWSTNFSPTGKLYATGSEDGTMKMWKFCDTPYGLWK